jgi:hypothetical protein
MTADQFDPECMRGYDVLYFRLHGTTASNLWFGESEDGSHCLALAAQQLCNVELDNPLVMIANCYAAESEMVQAFYRAGARYVVAGSGPNYAAGGRVIGTDKLVKKLISRLRRGYPALRALYIARLQLLTTVWRAADRDALEFRVVERI